MAMVFKDVKIFLNGEVLELDGEVILSVILSRLRKYYRNGGALSDEIYVTFDETTIYPFYLEPIVLIGGFTIVLKNTYKVRRGVKTIKQFHNFIDAVRWCVEQSLLKVKMF